MSGGIAGWIEKAVTGTNLGQLLKGLDKSGQNLYGRGQKYTDEGLAGLRDLDRRFNDQLANGGLTKDMERGFDVASGRLSDQYVRGGRNLRQSLEQQRRSGGGFLTPEAIASMTAEADQSRNEDYFDASNELGFSKAQLQQKSTQELYDRILSIRDSIRQTGLTEEQMGIMMRLQSAQLHYQRNKAISDAASDWASFGLKAGG